jgi:UDP-N-acetylmuramate: L-alanyl-gamma-D-glutamyl-meso-diaminopimelate ligase
MIESDEVEIPSTVHHIHLIAVCGTGMGALACMLKEMGYSVTGSDQHVYPPMSEFLDARGIPVFDGYQADNLKQPPDLVVVGNAVSRDNPEVQAMLSMKLPYCSMPRAVNRFAAKGKRQIVVMGTHGKTTTSSFIAWLLQCAGLDPSYLIGGIVSNFKSNYRAGKGDWIVLEGDEYDTAFFDKGPKFLHYTPAVAVLTSIEFDHADIFDDLEHVKSAFGRMLSRLPDNAVLMAYDRDANLADVLSGFEGHTIRYGLHPESDWRLGTMRIQPPETCFDVLKGKQRPVEFKTRMIGMHNLCNLLSGIAVGRHLDIDIDIISRALVTFQGVRRRQEIRGVKNDVVVLDDFAHHPTAVKATVEGVKQFYGDRRVIAVFEPRTNSSRRKVFQSVYPASFDAADMICIRQAGLLDKIPVDQRFSSEKLVADLVSRGKEAYFFQDTEGIIDHLVHIACPGDVVLIMSNGGFDNIHIRLLAAL